MTEPLLHDSTKREVEQLIAHQSQTVLLLAPVGAGKFYIATWMAEKLLDIHSGTLAEHPYYLHIAPTGASISIEQIRQLQRFLQLRTTGSKPLRRAIIIENAHMMTLEAQNALLKSLEEPPADTVLVLTATNTTDLLPTVCSRVQRITIKPPALAQIMASMSAIAEPTLKRLYALSDGHMGLLTALHTKDSDHPLTSSIEASKQLLRLSSYERLAQLEQIAPDKLAAERLVAALKHIARAALKQAAYAHKEAAITRWYGILHATHEAEKRLALAGNKKLVMTDLLLSL